MSKGKLGNLRLTEAWGPLQTLINRLASDEGEEYLDELKKFNRKDPCWVPETRESEFLGPYEIPASTPRDQKELIRIGRYQPHPRYSAETAFVDATEPFATTVWIYAPNRKIRVPEVEVALQQNGMVPGTYMDLLAFVATQELPAKTGRLIALGTAKEFAFDVVSPVVKFANSRRLGPKSRDTINRDHLIIGRPYFLARKAA